MDLERGIFQRVDQPPLAGRGRQHLGGVKLLGPSQQLSHDAVSALLIQTAIGHLPAQLSQMGRKLAHRCQNQSDLFGMMRHICALIQHFGHDHHIACGISRL